MSFLEPPLEVRVAKLMTVLDEGGHAHACKQQQQHMPVGRLWPHGRSWLVPLRLRRLRTMVKMRIMMMAINVTIIITITITITITIIITIIQMK